MIANSSPPQVDRLAVLLMGTLITLMVVGYPMAGLIATGLGLESTATSIPLRLLTLAISAATVLHIARAGRRVRMDAAVILFWWLYLLRLIFDARSGQFEDVGDALIFFLAAVVVPAAAVMIGAVGYNERFIAWRLFIVGTTICAASMLLDALGVGNVASLTEVTGRLSFKALNPISLGHVAATTVLAALVLWRKSQTPALRAGLSFGVAVAVVCLLLAALNHAHVLIQHGLAWDYGGVNSASAWYWTSLTIIDPLVAALLFVRPKIGIPLTVVLVTSNVAHNLAVMAVFAPEGEFLARAISNPLIISQVADRQRRRAIH